VSALVSVPIVIVALAIGILGAMLIRRRRNAAGAKDGVWSWKDGGPRNDGFD